MKRYSKVILLLPFIFLYLTSCNIIHVHTIIDGKCNCGFIEEHIHKFINGECVCGEKENQQSYYTITWKNEFGETLSQNEVLQNDIPQYEYILTNSDKYTYTFIGWSLEQGGEVLTNIPKASSDVTYYAIVQSTINNYNVNIYDEDNNITSVMSYPYDTVIEEPVHKLIDRYNFIGWKSETGELFTWPLTITKDINIYPCYEKETITVGSDKMFSTLQDAIDYALPKDTIYVDSGIYEGATIDKSVIIKGANACIEPTKSRNDETTFVSDLIINSSDVLIDGVELKGKARFTFDNLSCDITNIIFQYCKVSDSTVNANNERNTAPFNLVSNNNYYINNVIIDNCLIDRIADCRPMAIYIVDVIDLTITNSHFLGGGKTSNYNDAIKVDNFENANSTFGVKGNVVIQNNVFREYSQYAIWFRQYGNGTYTIKHNQFDAIGQTEDSHAAVNFIKACENINAIINVCENIVNDGYILFRIDEVNTYSKIECSVNENIMLNCCGTYYIKNGIKNILIDANNNYYGSKDISSKKFYGNVDYSSYYEEPINLTGYESIKLNYNVNTNLNVNDTIEILYECIGFEDSFVRWSSSDENIAVVDDFGKVTALKPGITTITIEIEEYDIEEKIVITVYDNISKMSDVEQFILTIMNNYSHSVTAANSRTNYGVTDPYLYSIYRGPVKYLFEDLLIDTESYKRSGEAKLINNKVEYITIHDTWALQRDAKGLAEFFQKDITSVHYTVGNDGIYQIIRLGDKGAHAGDSPYRAYELDKTNVLATTTNPIITMNDGYFVINGIQTNLRPYSDYEGKVQDMNNYTTEQITYSGIRCLIGDDGFYYLGKTYFNETYKTISNFGGNANSIGIEMASQRGTDFYLNMQRTAKLVAMLLNMYDLTTNDVKMHNYFSGKNCAQLLKNNLKYEYDYKIDEHDIKDTLWNEFLALCDAELQMLKFSELYDFEFVSSNTNLLSNTGQVIGHNVYDTFVDYVIRITDKQTGEIKEINSAILVPGSIKIDPCYIGR